MSRGRMAKLMSFRGLSMRPEDGSDPFGENSLTVKIPTTTVLPTAALKRISRNEEGKEETKTQLSSSSKKPGRLMSKSKSTMRSARNSVVRKFSNINMSFGGLGPREPVLFHVEVSGTRGSYTVKKEYKNFRKLHTTIKRNFPQIKKTIKNLPRLNMDKGTPNPEKIEEHRVFFESYLGTLLDLQPRPADLNNFLETKKHVRELKGREKTGFNTLDDFELVKRIGEGTFGTVYLVRAIESDEIFAMKVLKKEELRKKRQVEHTLTEMRVMSLSDHPYIVSLKFAFHTEDMLFMVIQYCPGGELFFHLKTQRKLSEETVRLYSAEIALALNYLHEKFIIFRDLKPENILLNKDGHVLITDFGLCKENVRGLYDAHTFCGTPEYLSPEMLIHRETKEGYGKGVDWWSLGVLMFEMLYGLPPFYHKNLKKMCERILRKKLNFPDQKASVDASLEIKNIMTGLLDREPTKRLGVSGEGFAEIKNHPFFTSTDWDKVYNMDIDPPYKPLITGDRFNVDNFDREFTDKPATLVTKKKKGPDDGPPDDEFQDFDYNCFKKMKTDFFNE